MKAASLFALVLLTSTGCDSPAATPPAPSASVSASAPPSAAPVVSSPPPAPAPSAPPATPVPGAAAKDVVVSELDPVSTPARTATVLGGGSVALYLPEWAGTSWRLTQPDASLGKAKEETIPGFAGPTTPAHAFTWKIKDALKGQTHKVVLTNAGKGPGGKLPTTFTLSIEVS